MRILALVGLVLSFATLSAPETPAQERFSKVVTDAGRWEPVDYKAPGECTGDAQECALKMLGESNISVGDEPAFSVYQLGEVDGKRVTVVFVSQLVEDDDSVLGRLYRLEMSLGDVEDKSYSLDAMGRMYQCMRGPEGWRKSVCP